jgi:hypothetical protein
MKSAVRIVLPAVLLLAAASVRADDPTKPDKKPAQKADRVGNVFKVPEGITLTEEQKSKVEALKKEWGDKLTAAFKKVDGVYSREQRKARTAARKAATDAGKKGKELREAVDAAVSLTDEQKKQLADAQTELKDLQTKARSGLTALFTDEQKKLLRKQKKSTKK